MGKGIEMKKLLNKIDLYFITDPKLTKKDIFEDANSAIRAGVKIIQYREKEKDTKYMIEEAAKIKEICKENNTLFLINDRVDIALAVDADGVHLGKEDMPYNIARNLLGEQRIIGLTVHNLEEAIEAENIGADYLGVSPIFETKTKPDAGKPSGLQLLIDLKENIKIPYVAIGGINEYNIKSVLDTGTRAVAIISAIITKDNVEEECKKFRKLILKTRNNIVRIT